MQGMNFIASLRLCRYELSRNVNPGIAAEIRIRLFALKIFLTGVGVTFFSFRFSFNVALFFIRHFRPPKSISF